MKFFALENLSSLHDGYQQAFAVEGRNLLLLQHDGQRYLMDNQCPHAGHPLVKSTVEAGKIRCPLHGICFSLKNGKAVNVENFPDDKCLVFHKPAYDGNKIGINLT